MTTCIKCMCLSSPPPPPPPPTHQTSSDLSSLVQIICATFSDKCPVYEAPSRHPPQHSLSQPSYPGYPHEAGYQPKPEYILSPSQRMYQPGGMPASQPVSPPSTGSYHYGYKPTDSVGQCPSPFPQTSVCCVLSSNTACAVFINRLACEHMICVYTCTSLECTCMYIVHTNYRLS